MTDDEFDQVLSRRKVMRRLAGLGILGFTACSTVEADSSTDASEISLQQRNINVRGLAYNGGFGFTIQGDEIIKFDIGTGEVINSIDAPDGSDKGLTYGGGSLWYSDGVSETYNGEIVELNPETGEIRSQIGTSYDVTALAFGGGSLWAADITYNNIVEFSPSGVERNSFDIQDPTGTTGPQSLAYFNGSLWLGEGGQQQNPSLYKFDTDGNLKSTVMSRDGGYAGGLATTDTELLGKNSDGDLTVLRTLQEGSGGDTDEITACLDSTEVTLDRTSEICITLRNFSNGFSGCELSFDFPNNVSPESVTTNDSFGLGSTDVRGQEVTISVTDTDNQFSGNIDSLQIGCVTVQGAEERSGTVTLESARVDNEEGISIETINFDGACREVSVVPGEQCPTVNGTQVTDPDGDGLCDDLNGNERQDFDDVVDFFDNISESDVTDNPEAFDFNGNDRVDFDDVVELFDEIR